MTDEIVIDDLIDIKDIEKIVEAIRNADEN